MDTTKLVNLSTMALDQQQWLRSIDGTIMAALKQAPWHLWLDKFSFPWAIRCDIAAKHWQTEAENANNRDYKRQCRQNADEFPSGKTAALLVAASLANRSSLIEECRRKMRWLDSFSKQLGSRFATIKLTQESRLLLHLGRANVLENVGLYFEHTTGLPQIPGTALKGVVSTWVTWANSFNSSTGSIQLPSQGTTTRRNFTAAGAGLARQILGDDSQNGSEHAGDVIFIGGFPMTPPQLGLDIVNPHYDAKGEPKNKLTPNTFLCIEPGTVWQFAFYVRAGTTNTQELLTTTSRWITEALTQLGIGAKTAAGYGRFREPTDADFKAVQHPAEAPQAAAQAQAQQIARTTQAARQQAAAQAALSSDYPNEKSFRNRVIDKLDPSRLDQLQSEIDLLKKPENASWLERLKQCLASKQYKEIRKKLQHKDWFPKDWLPQQ